MYEHFPSTSTMDSNSAKAVSAQEILFQEVHMTFLLVFIIYVCCSVAWVIYCCMSYHRDLEDVENKIQENSVSRQIELQRLLDAYERVRLPEGVKPPEDI